MYLIHLISRHCLQIASLLTPPICPSHACEILNSTLTLQKTFCKCWEKPIISTILVSLIASFNKSCWENLGRICCQSGLQEFHSVFLALVLLESLITIWLISLLLMWLHVSVSLYNHSNNPACLMENSPTKLWLKRWDGVTCQDLPRNCSKDIHSQRLCQASYYSWLVGNYTLLSAVSKPTSTCNVDKVLNHFGSQV